MNVSRLKTSAGVIETIDAGSGEAAVLLLHGNSGHKEVFARQVEELSPRYRVVVPDLLGHGGSEDAAEPGRDYTLAGHAGYLAELVTTLELGPMVVVGLSLGGHIGLELAAQSPRARGDCCWPGRRPLPRPRRVSARPGPKTRWCCCRQRRN
jgi:pimeloyl-ACP methyl ester carboxylesterase